MRPIIFLNKKLKKHINFFVHCSLNHPKKLQTNTLQATNMYHNNWCAATFQTTSAAQRRALHHHKALPTHINTKNTHTDLTFLPPAVVERERAVVLQSWSSFFSSPSTSSTKAGKLGSSRQTRRKGSRLPCGKEQWWYTCGRVTPRSPRKCCGRIRCREYFSASKLKRHSLEIN